MDWLFVLKDKGTSNQGWWLKISSLEELLEYIKITNPTKYGHVFENYLYDKEYGATTISHGPHLKEAPLTYAVVNYADRMKREHDGNGLTILQAIEGFAGMVAQNQWREIQESGAIYINSVGGYHGAHPSDKTYNFIRRKELVFPDFKRNEIRIKQFPGGEHFYAYIDDLQVRDGDTLKWDTYDAAYEMALSIIDES